MCAGCAGLYLDSFRNHPEVVELGNTEVPFLFMHVVCARAGVHMCA